MTTQVTWRAFGFAHFGGKIRFVVWQYFPGSSRAVSSYWYEQDTLGE